VFASIEQMGDLFLASDSFALALAEFSKAEDLPGWDALPPQRRNAILLKAARARAGLGDLEGALSAARKGLAQLGGPAIAPGAAGLTHAFLAQIHRKRGEHADALREGHEALVHLGGTDENAAIASLQLNLGAIYLREGQLRPAERHFQDGLATYRRVGDRSGVARALNSLGVVYNSLCEWQTAVRCLKDAAEIDESLGNFSQTILRCLNLGIVHSHTGDWGSARVLLERSLSMSRAVNDAIGVARASIALARLERWNRSFYRAERLVRDAIAATRDSGARREMAAALEEAGALAAARGDLALARARFDEALAMAAPIASVSDHTAEIERRIAEVALARDETDVAFERARRCYGAAVRVGERRIAAAALRTLGAVFARRGEAHRARASFTRAIRALERLGAPLELARTLREAGLPHAALWCAPNEARGYLTRAESLYRSLGLPRDVGDVLVERTRLEESLDNTLEALANLREAERAYTEAGDESALHEALRLRRRLEAESARATASLDAERLALAQTTRVRTADAATVLTRVLAAARADRGFVAWDEAGRIVVKACEGLAAGTAREIHRWIVQQHAEPIARGESAISYGGPTHDAEDVLSYVVVPIEGSDRRRGILYVDRVATQQQLPFGRLELHFLSSMGGVVSALLQATSEPSAARVPASPFPGVVTRSARMLEILDMLRRVAGASSTILLQGETGTGKGLLAYEVSRWNAGPFVTINCADLSETVLESELFGHARNAFTGAGGEKKGLFELADGGTVFIDEIDKTSRNFQERLLRVVDRREIKPVGSTIVKKVDCRIIVAANRDLRGQVERGEFLKDLYYRLRVIAIDLPSLRERKEDIPLLAAHFLKAFQAKMDKKGIHFSDSAMDVLQNHDWPGNIRDLENEVERAVALTPSDCAVEAGDLSEETVANPFGAAPAVTERRKRLADVVEEIEIRMVRDAMQRHGGNKSRAAADLGLTRRGLKNKLARYDLE
jgi:DNA-binding NtrC family response regulator/tetratricopeptide (TPR) repeat protein